MTAPDSLGRQDALDVVSSFRTLLSRGSVRVAAGVVGVERAAHSVGAVLLVVLDRCAPQHPVGNRQENVAVDQALPGVAQQVRDDARAAVAAVPLGRRVVLK